MHQENAPLIILPQNLQSFMLNSPHTIISSKQCYHLQNIFSLHPSTDDQIYENEPTEKLNGSLQRGGDSKYGILNSPPLPCGMYVEPHDVDDFVFLSSS